MAAEPDVTVRVQVFIDTVPCADLQTRIPAGAAATLPRELEKWLEDHRV